MMALDHEYEITQAKVEVGHSIPDPIPPTGSGWSLLKQSLEKEKEGLFIIWQWSRPKGQNTQNEEGEYLVQDR